MGSGKKGGSHPAAYLFMAAATVAVIAAAIFILPASGGASVSETAECETAYCASPADPAENTPMPYSDGIALVIAGAGTAVILLSWFVGHLRRRNR